MRCPSGVGTITTIDLMLQEVEARWAADPIWVRTKESSDEVGAIVVVAVVHHPTLTIMVSTRVGRTKAGLVVQGDTITTITRAQATTKAVG